jgi:hypothetical protein
MLRAEMARHLEARLTDGTVRRIRAPAEVDPGVVLGKLTGIGESSEWPTEKIDWLPTQDGSLIRTTAIIELRLVEVADEPLVA